MLGVEGLVLTTTVALLLALVIGYAVGGRRLQALALVGVFARILGSTTRIEVGRSFYHSLGDSAMYFARGIEYREYLLAGDLDRYTTFVGHWWGTQFVRWVASLVMVLTGDSYRGTAMFFSCFSLLGLLLVAERVRPMLPAPTGDRFAYAVVLWPSLCYWPASIGKDTLMILALGLTLFGALGRRSAANLVGLGLGLGLAFCVRPHIAGALATSVALAELLRPRKQQTTPVRRAMLVGGFLLLASATVYAGLTQLTGGDADYVSVLEKFESRSARTAKGGSVIAMSSGPLAVPMALITVLLRPFPWEAHHALAALAGAEVWLLWVLLLRRRRHLGATLRAWRTIPLLRLALPALGLTALMYGLAFSNLGIITRQRVILLPLCFIIVAVVTSTERAQALARAPARGLVTAGGAT